MKKKIAWLLIISMFVVAFLPLLPSHADRIDADTPIPIKSLPAVRRIHPGVDLNNPYYGAKRISNNPFPNNDGYNCTWYAFGRVSELLGSGWENRLARRGDAKEWFEKNNKKNGGAYECGTEPRLGAIVCWNYDPCGHVAVVEAIYSDGTIGFSESNFDKKYGNFNYKTKNPRNSNFQGYIYVFPEDYFDKPKESDSEIQEGEYKIVSNVGEDKVIEVEPDNSDNGANVRLGIFNGGEHQKWKLKKKEDSTFQIISATTGKVLDVKDGSLSDGANVHIWNNEELDNQKWYILKSYDNGWHNFIAKHSGKAMDVTNVENAAGVNIQQWQKQYNESYRKAQNFRLERFDAPTPNPKPSEKQRDVVLTLDVSGSMSGDRIHNTKKASKKFIDTLLSKSTDTKIGIVTYESNVRVVSELTNDKQALLSAVDSLTDLGGTNIYGGLEAAGNLLANSYAKEKAIVIMTDGEANEGKTMPPETIITEDGAFSFDEYETAIYRLAEEYKNQRGYKIYSLGFGLSEDTSAYHLMKYISSLFSGKHAFWSINNQNVEKIVFDFEDIADTIEEKDRILIRIHCPVEVQITKNGETLDKNSLASSFGRVNISEAKDGHQYLFSLEYATDYQIFVQGIGNGVMNFHLTYKVGGKEDSRSFVAVPISPTTRIHADSTDLQQNFVLFTDQNGDGMIDEKWVAGENKVIHTPSAYEEDMRQETRHTRHFEIYTLSFKTNGGTYLSSISKPNGRKLDLSDYIPMKSGFVFDGWYSDSNFTTKITSVTFNEDKTVYAKWNPVTPTVTSMMPSLPFADVKDGDWFKEDVEYVWKKGIMNGLSSSTFGPYDTTTRAMIVTVLWRIEQEPNSNQTVTFKDVSENSYYATAVRWAVENEIINGYNETTFGSNDFITLEQMAAIVHRYAKMKGWNAENGNGVMDNKQYQVSPYALSSVQWAISHDMLKGIESNILIGNTNANRAQISACLHKLSSLEK